MSLNHLSNDYDIIVDRFHMIQIHDLGMDEAGSFLNEILA